MIKRSYLRDLDIPVSFLHEYGIKIPIELKDILAFVRNNLLDTSDCCELLDCSRQNLHYMQEQGSLTPIKADVKGSLFLKGEVLKNMW